jgi:hypothetical protein
MHRPAVSNLSGASKVEAKEPPDAPTHCTAYPDELLDELLVGADAKTAFDATGVLDALRVSLIRLMALAAI